VENGSLSLSIHGATSVRWTLVGTEDGSGEWVFVIEYSRSD